MIYALVKAGVIANMIVSSVTPDLTGFDAAVAMTPTAGGPGVGSVCTKCDGTDFTGASTSTNSFQAQLDGKLDNSFIQSTPSRALNANFTPSSFKVTLVTYTISISASATIAGGGQTGTVELRSDTSATPTTARASVSNTNSVSLAIAVGVVNTQVAVLSWLVPAGYNVRLVSSGTATISILSQTEVTIG